MEHPREAAARWNREHQASADAQPCPVTHPLQPVALCSSVWEILERGQPVRENNKLWGSAAIRVMKIPAQCKLWFFVVLPVLRARGGSSPNNGKGRPPSPHCAETAQLRAFWRRMAVESPLPTRTQGVQKTSAWGHLRGYTPPFTHFPRVLLQVMIHKSLNRVTLRSMRTPSIIQLSTHTTGVVGQKVPTDNPAHLGAPTLGNRLAPLFVHKTLLELVNHGAWKHADEIQCFLLHKLVPNQLHSNHLGGGIVQFCLQQQIHNKSPDFLYTPPFISILPFQMQDSRMKISEGGSVTNG